LDRTQETLLEYITAKSPAALTIHACRLLVEIAIGFGLVSRERIETTEDLMRNFVASVAHEMRFPLDHLLKANKLLQEAVQERGDDELLQHVVEIESSGNLLGNLIDDYLEFARSRVNKDKVALNLETFDVFHTIQKMVDVFQRLADQKDNTLTIDCAEDVGTMYADERRVQQILLNLVNNACKFTEHGKVSLATYRETKEGIETIVFKVSDTGIGIPPERQPELFIQPLHLGPDTHVGLIICNQFCRIMGGDISVESEVGKGTTFTVRLPAYVESKDSTH
jgi:signal transduction histidine kinase